jgi:hypothetical protein
MLALQRSAAGDHPDDPNRPNPSKTAIHATPLARILPVDIKHQVSPPLAMRVEEQVCNRQGAKCVA